jgi:hypothetical protein
VNHGAGFTPTVVIAIWTGGGLGGGPAGVLGTDSITATQFRLRMGGITEATALSGKFLALA